MSFKESAEKLKNKGKEVYEKSRETYKRGKETYNKLIETKERDKPQKSTAYPNSELKVKLGKLKPIRKQRVVGITGAFMQPSVFSSNYTKSIPKKIIKKKKQVKKKRKKSKR